MSFYFGLLSGLALGNKNVNRRIRGIWLKPVGSHDTDPFSKQDAKPKPLLGSILDVLDEWPCQALLGGAGFAIRENVDGMCTHPECHPANKD